MFVFIFLCDSSAHFLHLLPRPGDGKSPGRSMPEPLPLPLSALSLTAPWGVPEEAAHMFFFFLWSDSPHFVPASIDRVLNRGPPQSCKEQQGANKSAVLVTSGAPTPKSRKFYLVLLLLMLDVLLESGFELLLNGLLRGATVPLVHRLWSTWPMEHLRGPPRAT